MRALIVFILFPFYSFCQDLQFVIQKGHSEGISKITLLENQLIATKSIHKKNVLWDARTGKIIQNSDEFDPRMLPEKDMFESRHLPYVTDDMLGVFQTFMWHGGYTYLGDEYHVQSDGKRVIAYTKEGKKVFSTYDEHSADVVSMEHDPELGLFYVGLKDGDLLILNDKTGRLKKRIKLHQSAILTLVVDQVNHILYSGSTDRTMKAWDPQKNKLVHHYYGDSFKPRSLIFSKDGNTLYFGDELGRFSSLSFDDYVPNLTSVQISDYSLDFLAVKGETIVGMDNNGKHHKQDLFKGNKHKGKVLKGNLKQKFDYRSDQKIGGYKAPLLDIILGKSSRSGKYYAVWSEVNYNDFDKSVLSLIDQQSGVVRQLQLSNYIFDFLKDALVFIDKDNHLSKFVWEKRKIVKIFSKMKWMNMVVLNDSSIMLQSSTGSLFIYHPMTEKLEEIAFVDELSGQLSCKQGFVVEDKDDELNFYQLNHNTLKKVYTIATGNKGFDVHPNRNTVVLIDQQDRIVFHQLKSLGEPIFFTNSFYDDYAFYDQENNYFIPKTKLEFLGYNFKNRFVYPYQFDRFFNRPDLVLTKTGLMDNEKSQLLKRLTLKRKKSNNLPNYNNLPELVLKDVTEKGLDSLRFSVELKNVGESSGIIRRLNGVVFDTIPFSEEFSLPRINGQTRVELSCYDENKIESVRVSYDDQGIDKKSDLFIVSIGISNFNQFEFNLNYASKDAVGINSAISKKCRGRYQQIHELIITDVTVHSLRVILDSIRQTTCLHDDFILFFAGHGLLDENYEYFFACKDMDFQNPSSNGLSFNEIENLLATIPCNKKMLIMDSCHSGEVDKDDIKKVEKTVNNGDIVFRSDGQEYQNEHELSTAKMAKMVFSDVNNLSGANIIASASGHEYAAESKKYQNGYFTYAFIKALASRKTDTNKDHKVYLDELMNEVEPRVKKMSNGLQEPNLRNENSFTFIRFD